MLAGYEAVAPRPGPGPGSTHRLVAARGAAFLCACALLVFASHGRAPAGPSGLFAQNPATRGSDTEEHFPARQYLGGALAIEQFPPQCLRGGSGGQRCEGLARDCAQCLDGSGECNPRERGSGDIRLRKRDGVGKHGYYYYLNIDVPLGHPVAVMLRSTDGYSREWNQVGSLWTDKIHQPCAQGRTPGAVDLVQVIDGTTGEMAFFRFPCEGSSRCGKPYWPYPPPVLTPSSPSRGWASGARERVIAQVQTKPLTSTPRAPEEAGTTWVPGAITPPQGLPGAPGAPGPQGEIAIKILPGPPVLFNIHLYRASLC